MYKEISKGKAALMAFAIWLSGFAIYFSMLPIVITNDLYVTFPNNAGAITAALSWPSLVCAVAGILAGKLLTKISTKKELIIGTVLCLVGVIPAFVSTVKMFVLVSFIQGAGAGFINTAAMAMISEVYVDESKRAKQMGFFNAAGSAMGFLLTYIAGILAVKGWYVPFQCFWFAVPVLLLIIVFTPEIKPSQRTIENNSEIPTKKGSIKDLGPRFWTCFVSTFIWFCAYCCFFTFNSVYISEHALGDVTFTGLCTSISTVGSLIAALVFGFVYSKIGRKFHIICAILPLIFYFIAYTAPSRAVTIIFMIIYGFTYGAFFTSIYAYAADVVPTSCNGLAMGIMTFNYAVALPVAITIFSSLMQSKGSLTATMPIAMVLLAVSVIIEIVCCAREKKFKTAE